MSNKYNLILLFCIWEGGDPTSACTSNDQEKVIRKHYFDVFDVGALSFVTFLWANKEKLIMHIDSIKHLKTRDVFILSFYCSIGLSLIGFLLILFAQILGVPMVFNGVKYSGLLGVLYSFLIIPIWIICFTVAFGFYLSLGWKLARVILPVFGFWPKNDA